MARLRAASLRFAGISAAAINHMNVNVPAIFLTIFSPSISQSLIRSSASGFLFRVRTANLWTQQRLDGAALVHGAISLGYLLERQLEIEDFAGIDGPVLHQLNQLGKVAAHGRRTAVQVHVRVEQLRAAELHTVRNPDVADGSATIDDGTKGGFDPYRGPGGVFHAAGIISSMRPRPSKRLTGIQ